MSVPSLLSLSLSGAGGPHPVASGLSLCPPAGRGDRDLGAAHSQRQGSAMPVLPDGRRETCPSVTHG